MLKIEIITDKKDIEEFRKFLPTDRNFPYDVEMLLEYIKNHIGIDTYLFLKAVKNGEIVGVAFSEQWELPPAYTVVFMGSHDRIATIEMSYCFVKHAQFLRYDTIQYITTNKHQAMLKLTGGKVLGVICGGKVEDAIKDYDRLLGRLKTWTK